MSKGQIVSVLGDGQYRVKLLMDTARLDGYIQLHTQKISAIQSTISSKYTELSGTEDLDERRTIERAISALKLKLAASENQLAYLNDQHPEEDIEISAWCADYMPGLAAGTVVALADVAGDREMGVNIRPAYSDDAAYLLSRDGFFQPAVSGSVPSLWINYSVYPGWQKYLSRYRYGTITSIDPPTDTCSVSVEAAASWAQGLDVNQATTLSSVPIEYMSCNAAAFSVDDDVLIEFEDPTDWATAIVCGFKSNPKTCVKEFASFYWNVWGFGSGAYDDYVALVWDIAANAPADVADLNNLIPTNPCYLSFGGSDWDNSFEDMIYGTDIETVSSFLFDDVLINNQAMPSVDDATCAVAVEQTDSYTASVNGNTGLNSRYIHRWLTCEPCDDGLNSIDRSTGFDERLIQDYELDLIYKLVPLNGAAWETDYFCSAQTLYDRTRSYSYGYSDVGDGFCLNYAVSRERTITQDVQVSYLLPRGVQTPIWSGQRVDHDQYASTVDNPDWPTLVAKTSPLSMTGDFVSIWSTLRAGYETSGASFYRFHLMDGMYSDVSMVQLFIAGAGGSTDVEVLGSAATMDTTFEVQPGSIPRSPELESAVKTLLQECLAHSIGDNEEVILDWYDYRIFRMAAV